MSLPPFLAAHLGRTPAVATIPAGADFLRALVAPIVEAYRDDPLGLSRLTLFLPNRRAIRTVAVLFGEFAGDGETAILPRLRALGDIAEEDLLMSGEPPQEALDLDPPADPTARRLILARLIHQREVSEGRGGDWPHAIRTADMLGQFLDGLHRDDVAFEALANFSPDDAGAEVAAHWQRSLEFLSILGAAWPAIMEGYGWIEPAARRTRLMKALAGTVRKRSGGNPVIVAGALGTVRGTAEFMADIARSDSGVVVLPGLDTGMDEAAWEKIEESHPQAVFREWLRDDLDDLSRAEVQEWGGVSEEQSARRDFLSLALSPANATDSWYEGFSALSSTGQLATACKGLSLIDAESADEEAALISLRLREALDVPDRTAMLVTPDRDLARRVCVKLRAWGVDVDDTGGTPLGGTVRGTFLRAVVSWLSDPASAVALMQLLNHELCSWGQGPDIVRRTARLTDMKLRGPKFPSWERMAPTLAAVVEGCPEASVLFDHLSAALMRFEAATHSREQLGVATELAEWLATALEETGAARLWRYEDGEELARTLEGLMRTEHLPDAVIPARFAALVETLMGGTLVRRRGVGHPRLFVYGLVEARLQTADLTILAGLNEGVWPDAVPEDPFLSRGMRRALGLTSPELSIGRAAHDFEQHAARPEVVLSRSRRHGRSPSNPSRWWVRIESFLRTAKVLADIDITPRLRALRDLREDIPAGTAPDPAMPPAPCPPAEARPDSVSVTDIGKLMRDPYAVYARRILRLKPLDSLDMPFGYRERGLILHEFVETLSQQIKEGNVSDAQIAALVDTILEAYRAPEGQALLWRRNFARALGVWEATEETARGEGQTEGVEIAGEWPLSLSGRELRLIGRADRIDSRKDGTLSIVDFKTGGLPTMKEEASFDPQLSVLALMSRAGVLGDFGSRDVYRVAYLSLLEEDAEAPIYRDLQGKRDDGKYALSGEALTEHLAEVDERLRKLLGDVVSGRRAFPSQVYPKKSGDVGDYDHLARRSEWGLRAGGGDGGDGD